MRVPFREKPQVGAAWGFSFPAPMPDHPTLGVVSQKPEQYSLSSRVGMRGVYLDELCAGLSDGESPHRPAHGSPGGAARKEDSPRPSNPLNKPPQKGDPRKSLLPSASCAKVSAIRNFKLI